MLDKKVLRQQMKKQISLLSSEDYTDGSLAAVNLLMSLPEWKAAKTIGVTMSTREEIDTEALIRRAWAENKRIAVPKVDVKEKTMDFRLIRTFEDAVEAFAGIREPTLDRTTSVVPSEIDLLIVPGLVFDEKGFRIGFGGGFYDRFLIHYQGKKVSLAFDFQVMSEIPTETFDLPVEIIVTNERIIRAGGSK